ncbi:RAMP superfamily CRISPR-associated protein [Nocardia salmonicida]|uniref:RAMP superfamily CRISPR-associated protein n=1 Tax=Nocardia salmonicida TaxID=53431 RepID=UPI0037A3BE29
MGRLSSRYTLRGTLVADSALHVGGYGPATTVDLVQVRDGLGRVVLPGTSLAGVIRHALLDDDPAWWGTHLSGGEDSDRDAVASAITVADAPAIGDATLAVRDGVGIDRATGTAARRHLYTRDVVTAGTTFTFCLHIEVTDPARDRAAREQAAAIYALLVAGITIGGAGTRGLGKIRLTDPVLRREDFTTAAGLFAALETGGEPVVAEPAAAPHAILRITAAWRALGPVMSKVADAGTEAAAFPAVAQDATGIRLLIPGSSVKGTLRAHAERIVATLVDPPPPPPGLLDQLACTAALPAIGELFGAAGDVASGNPGRRGLLSVRDITSTVVLPARQWRRLRSPSVGGKREQGRRAFADAVAALNAITEPQGLWFDIAARNAIDRWTGAAADGALFTAVEPYAVGPHRETAWTALELELDIARARRTQAPVDAMIALLVLVLRDFAEGWIPLGFGTTRGLGSVRADPTAIRFDYIGPPGNDDHLAALHGRTLREVLDDSTIADPLEKAWHTIISSADRPVR